MPNVVTGDKEVLYRKSNREGKVGYFDLGRQTRSLKGSGSYELLVAARRSIPDKHTKDLPVEGTERWPRWPKHDSNGTSGMKGISRS